MTHIKVGKSNIVNDNRLKLLVVFVLSLVIFSGFIWLRERKEPAELSDKNYLPVSAKVLDSGIKFQTEPVIPLVAGKEYFVNYRIEREQYRQESKTMLSVLLNSGDKKTKEKAEIQWLELANKIEKEDEIENMLIIKGIEDVVANVNENSVRLIIFSSEDVTEKEAKMIREIAAQIAKIKSESITISAIKK